MDVFDGDRFEEVLVFTLLSLRVEFLLGFKSGVGASMNLYSSGILDVAGSMRG